MSISISSLRFNMSPRRMFGVLVAGLLILGNQHASASDGKAFYEFEGTVTKGGAVRFAISGNDTIQFPGIGLILTNGQTAVQVANALKSKLEEGDWTNQLNGYTFTVQGVPSGTPTRYVLLGTPNQNPFDQTYTQLKLIGVWNGDGVRGLRMSSGQDPVYGMAQWDVFASGDPFEGGLITIGIAGTTVSTPTDGKDEFTIKDDLLIGLHVAGFGTAIIDPDTGYLTIPSVELGDPIVTDGVDRGAEFTTTDGGFGGLALVTVPEPSAAVLTGISLLLCVSFRRHRAA